MFQHATTTHRDRRVTFKFDGPVLESTPEDGAEVWHERVKLVCMHNADNKTYEAHVAWCKASERNGFVVEQTAIFTDPFALVATEPAARFSNNKFSLFCSNVQQLCTAAAADQNNVSAAAELLRKAVSYSLVKN
jgi:hypothetical protein